MISQVETNLSPDLSARTQRGCSGPHIAIVPRNGRLNPYAWLQLLTALLLAGCVGNTPLPDYHYYRLSIAAPERLDEMKAGLVLVDAPNAPAVYAPRAIAHSQDTGTPALEHYHYHAWIDPPARLLQQELVRHLQDMNISSAVVADAGRGIPDYHISGEIRRFERFQTAQGWSAVVEIEFRLDAASNTGPLLVRSYKQAVVARDKTMEGTVEAFSGAVSGVFRDFSKDLTLVINQQRTRTGDN